MEGFLLIDKPAGITSHDVVNAIRHLTKERTVGHAGTLDPFATGLLLVAVGRSYTKQLSKFVGMEKEYLATMRFGFASTTGDPEGIITQAEQVVPVTETMLRITLQNFLGPQKQTPPMYSAKKVAGQKLYTLARQGKTVEREPIAITVFDLALVSWGKETATIRATVSSGTYMRTLSEDVGKALGVGAYLTALRRTKIGPYTIESALPLHTLKAPLSFQSLNH